MINDNGFHLPFFHPFDALLHARPSYLPNDEKEGKIPKINIFRLLNANLIFHRGNEIDEKCRKTLFFRRDFARAYYRC